MKKAIRGSITDVRLLTPDQAQAYVGMGRTMCRKWCDEIGATRRFGSNIRFDKVVIDKALDELVTEGNS